MCQIVGQVLWGFTYKEGISAPGAFIMDTGEAALDSPVHSLCCHPGCTRNDAKTWTLLSSDQFSSVAQSCLTLCDPMDCSTARLPCLSPTPGAYSNSCPLSWWCHPTVSSSVIPLSSQPSIFPSIRVFSSESALRIRWPKYWSFSFNTIPSMNTQDWFPSGWTGWISLQSKGLSRVFFNTTVQKHQFFGAQLSL